MLRSNRIAIKATTLFLFALLLLSCAFCSNQQPGFFDIFYKIRVEEDSHYFTLRFVQINDKTTPEAEHELDLSQDLTSPQVCAAVESDMSSPYNLKLTFTCMRNQSNASFVGKYKAKIYKYIGNVPSAENLTPITSSTGNDVSDVNVTSASKSVTFAGTYNSISEVYYPIAFSLSDYIEDYGTGSFSGTITLEVAPQ